MLQNLGKQTSYVFVLQKKRHCCDINQHVTCHHSSVQSIRKISLVLLLWGCREKNLLEVMTTSAPLFFFRKTHPAFVAFCPTVSFRDLRCCEQRKKLAVSRKVGEHIEPIALALGYRPNSYDQAIAWRP